jgi:hypothetical protein
MINQTFAHMWRSALPMLSPLCLIDRILDWVDELGAAILPVQGGTRSCQLARFEVRLD